MDSENENDLETPCSEEEPMSEDETPTTSDEEFIVSDQEEEDSVEELIEENENLRKENKNLKNQLKKLKGIERKCFSLTPKKVENCWPTEPLSGSSSFHFSTTLSLREVFCALFCPPPLRPLGHLQTP